MEKNIKKVAVLGAGTMGAQIAGHLANAGIPSLLFDMDQELAEKGKETLTSLKPAPLYKGDNIEEVKKLFDLGVDFPLVNDIVGFMEHAQQLKLEPITPIFSPE